MVVHEELWTVDVPRSSEFPLPFPVTASGYLAFVSDETRVRTLDLTTGEPAWSIEIGYHKGGSGKPYAISEGVVYVGYQLEDSGIMALPPLAPDRPGDLSHCVSVSETLPLPPSPRSSRTPRRASARRPSDCRERRCPQL